MEHRYWVYILCSERNGTLYIGVTNDLARRVHQHKSKSLGGFTNTYNVNRLVYAEEFQYVYDALYREKCLKRWKREWKLKLIEGYNPAWKDLYEELIF